MPKTDVATAPARPVQAYKVKHPRAWEIAKLAISALIVTVGAVIAFYLYTLKEAPPTKESNALIQQVVTAPAEPYSGMLFLEVSGIVVPHREIKVAAEVAGRILKRYPACENGIFVSAGEPLLEIDREAYELELKTLEADVVQAERRIEENRQQILGEERSIKLVQSDLELQGKELERTHKISSALSQSELDQATRAVNTAQQQLTTRENNLNTLRASAQRLEAALELSRQQIEKAKLNLRRTTIYAPTDGVIVRVMVNEGDFVNAGASVVLFEDTLQAEVLINLTPGELKWIRDHSAPENRLSAKETPHRSVYRIPPTEVMIYDPIEPEISWKGMLNRIDGIGRDDVTKTIPCRITVAQPVIETATGLTALVRGMFVKCRMGVHVTSGESNLLSIPDVALHPDNSVWVVNSDRKLKQVKVKVVNRMEVAQSSGQQQYVVIKAEPGQIRVGDTVVVTPLSQPFPGMPVLLEDSNSVPTLGDSNSIEKTTGAARPEGPVRESLSGRSGEGE
jgi:multidrug efflux pump subunit AcrA (membrane-fusion protein)